MLFRSLTGCAEIGLEVGVRWYNFTNLRKDSAKIGISIENQQGGLCVPPAKVGQKLIERGK